MARLATLTATLALALSGAAGCGDDEEKDAKPVATPDSTETAASPAQTQTSSTTPRGEEEEKKKPPASGREEAKGRETAAAEPSEKARCEAKVGEQLEKLRRKQREGNKPQGNQGAEKERELGDRRKRCSEPRRRSRPRRVVNAEVKPPDLRRAERCLKRAGGSSARRMARCLGLSARQLERQMLRGCEALRRSGKANRTALRQCRALAREQASRR